MVATKDCNDMQEMQSKECLHDKTLGMSGRNQDLSRSFSVDSRHDETN